MTGFDWAVVLVIGASTLLGWLRGAIREVFALLALLGALFAVRWLASDVAVWLPDSIPGAGLRTLAAGFAVWVVSWITLTLLSLWLRQLTHGFGFGGADRLFGTVFGLTRGLAIVMIVVLVTSHTPLSRQPFWQRAIMSASLERAAERMYNWVRERPKTRQTGDEGVVKVIESKEIGARYARLMV